MESVVRRSCLLYAVVDCMHGIAMKMDKGSQIFCLGIDVDRVFVVLEFRVVPAVLPPLFVLHCMNHDLRLSRVVVDAPCCLFLDGFVDALRERFGIVEREKLSVVVDVYVSVQEHNWWDLEGGVVSNKPLWGVESESCVRVVFQVVFSLHFLVGHDEEKRPKWISLWNSSRDFHCDAVGVFGGGIVTVSDPVDEFVPKDRIQDAGVERGDDSSLF